MYNFQTMQPVDHVYVLPRCQVQIFEDPGDGTAGALVWEGKNIDNLRVADSIDRLESPSTGIPYPKRHAMAERHQITFDGLWHLAATLSRSNEYICVVTWQNAEFEAAAEHWVRRCYFKVTTDSSSLSSRDNNEFGQDIALTAGYFIQSDGSGEPVSVIEGSEVCSV